MKKVLASVMFLSVVATTATASNVAIVDSGTFFDHKLLQGRNWSNPSEVANNNFDDDKNGKIDDVMGWNFADKDNNIFYPNHTQAIHPHIYRIFQILGKIDTNTMTNEDREFWNSNVAKLPREKKKKLIDQLNFYGQYAHGTHCSGIVALGNPYATLMSSRVFPNSEPPPPHDLFAHFNFKTFLETASVHDMLAARANEEFIDVAHYLKVTDMEVANYSLGISLPELAKKILEMNGNANPTQSEIREETLKLFVAFEPVGRKWIESSPNTLFVLAAGNDTTDIDDLPFFPASIKTENSITVAASYGYLKIADFSNFGRTAVDVAAPGVAVMSTVPNPSADLLLPMSGTSMAAPFVTMVASGIKDINDSLTPAEVKAIIMGTVDVKSWLTDKVATGGVVNQHRAFRASQLSTYLTLPEAILAARNDVADMPEEELFSAAAVEKQVPVTEEMRDFARQFVF